MKTPFDDFTLEDYADSPQQLNGVDCGVFTILNAYFLSIHSDVKLLNYTQDDARSYRECIANCLLSGGIL